MSTIKEVADLAGVAVGTVSHVINGAVPVSEPLRRKVLAAIRELDYHPNHIARSLKTSKTRTLGIIVPDMTIPFFPKVIRGAESAARQRNYSLIAVNSDDSDKRQSELLSLLRSQRVEGILLVIAAGPTPLSQISGITGQGIRMVCLDRIPDRLPVDTVSVEDIGAAELAVEHLISMGHRRIAVVMGPRSLRNERHRLLGYERSLQRAGIPFDENLIWTGTLQPEDVAAMCRKNLEVIQPRPDAIFSTNGPTGLGVLRAFRALGLNTPGDIALVTFDELTVDDLFMPAITTVVQPAYEIGFRAAEILIQRIEDSSVEREPVKIQLPATLKVRDSSRSPARPALPGRRVRRPAAPPAPAL